MAEPPPEIVIDDALIYSNGVSADSGEYLAAPVSFEQIADAARGKPVDSKISGWLKSIFRHLTNSHLGLPLGQRPEKLDEAGWGVVFHKEEGQRLKDVVRRLVEHRAKQVPSDRLKVLTYHEGESAADFLAGYGIGAGAVDPKNVPYYLLLVGSPERIPFLVGHHLDVEYATGRLHFDTRDEYEQYITSLIDYESSVQTTTSPNVALFGTNHDPPTRLSCECLVNPLAESLISTYGAQAISTLTNEKATKQAFKALFEPPDGATSPNVVFAASHGLFVESGNAHQEDEQGALLCQEWRGPGTMDEDRRFAAKDVSNAARIHGLVAFLFGCYTAGTPDRDRFSAGSGGPAELAKRPFIAKLPRRLLAHPKGGAIACIGHVDRVWSCSFRPPKVGQMIQPFDNALKSILSGIPVGHAVRDFRMRYASLSTQLASMLEQERVTRKPAPAKNLAMKWTERNDAEGYVVLGDPAARLRVTKMP